MSSDTGARGGQTAARHDAVHRLNHDWLSGLLGQFVRAAGLLHPVHGPFGHTSLSEAWALMELADGEPLTQRDLGERLDLEKSTVSRLVVAMERKGLITRRRNPENRRFAEVAITAHGREVADHLASDMLDRHALIFDDMTTAEREALATGLAALVRAMRHAHGHLGGAQRHPNG